MQRTSTSPWPLTPGPCHRRGLAPLELVLNLPILLFVMALMVNFGVVAAWKVRAAGAAREAMWRDRATYQGGADPKPANFWPNNATLTAGGTSDLSTIDAQWNRQEIAHPLARGPIITPAQGGGNAYIQVRDRRYFEMREGMRQGSSHVERTLPFLSQALGSHGTYQFDIRHPLLDSRWQFHTQGYGDNYIRRAKNWYVLESQGEWAAEEARFRAADAALVGNPTGMDLIPLDRDPEFLAYYGGVRDFHPRYVPECQIDPTIVQQNSITGYGGLVDRIQGRPRMGNMAGVPGVARTMAEAFKRMYEEQLRALQMQMPPPPNLDQLTQDLQQKIDALNQFLGTLPPV